MPRILAAPGGALLEKLAKPAFARLGLRCAAAEDLAVLVRALGNAPADLVILHGDLADATATEAARRLRSERRWQRIKLLAVLPREQAPTAAGDFDACLESPVTEVVLLGEIARLLDLPYRVAPRRPVAVPVEITGLGRPSDRRTDRRGFLRMAPLALREGGRAHAAHMVDLSETGVRVMVMDRPQFEAGDKVNLTIKRRGGKDLVLGGRVAWVGGEDAVGGRAVGVQFASLEPAARRFVLGLLQWEIHVRENGVRAVLRTDILPDLVYDRVTTSLKGAVSLDLAQARYVDQAAVPDWKFFIGRVSRIHGCSLVRCSTVFLAAAARDEALLGQAEVVSLCLRTTCASCGSTDEVVVGAPDAAAGAGGVPPPCSHCGGAVEREAIGEDVKALLRARAAAP